LAARTAENRIRFICFRTGSIDMQAVNGDGENGESLMKNNIGYDPYQHRDVKYPTS